MLGFIVITLLFAPPESSVMTAASKYSLSEGKQQHGSKCLLRAYTGRGLLSRKSLSLCLSLTHTHIHPNTDIDSFSKTRLKC